jgi:hypothetical protein
LSSEKDLASDVEDGMLTPHSWYPLSCGGLSTSGTF